MKNFMGRTMAKMNDNRKKGRKALKGFTLVEIIVVLVILAILAAAMIPALTGYIDKAKEKTLVAEARNAVTAAQTLASEAYGLGRDVESVDLPTGKLPSEGYSYKSMKELADIKGEIIEVKIVKGKVTGLVYQAELATGETAKTAGRFIKYDSTTGFSDLIDTSKTDSSGDKFKVPSLKSTSTK